MRKTFRTTILAALCGSTAFSALPPEALAGPMTVAPPSAVSVTPPTTQVHYRRYVRHYRHWGYYRPRYYRGWGYARPYYRPYYRRAYYRYPAYGYPAYYGGYDPAGAMFAGAALGIMGAGLAAATAPRWGWGWGGGWGGWGWGPGFGWGGPGFGWGGWW